jgi:hypothetical protein
MDKCVNFKEKKKEKKRVFVNEENIVELKLSFGNDH